MLDAAAGDQFVGKGSQTLGFALEHQHLKAVVVIQVHVKRGDNKIVVIVLDSHGTFGAA